MSSSEAHSRADDVLDYVRADAPIERREQDRLRRAPLAEAIADQVIHGPPGHGLVIGVVGKWGSGKTSVLKMVEEAVCERSNVVVLSFNPWLFSDADQLVTRFLDELAAQLRVAGKREGASAKLGRASERISTYAESLEPLFWLPIIGPWASRISSGAKLLKSIRKARGEQPSAEAQRESVRDALRELEHRVLVVIDDLDRIEAAQIRDIVRLVKLVGDFPNVTYLISYDRGPVEAALGQTPEEGSVYLEKIVQVVHDLPDPPREAILSILLDELQVTVDSIPTGPFHNEDWQNIFPAGLRPFFRTLRDVRRYLNAAPVSLRVIGPEVAVVDVLALEALRVFTPEAYAELPASVSILTAEERDRRGGRGDVEAARITAIVEAAGRFDQPVKEILRRLFPAVGNHLGGSGLVGGSQRARQDLRVSHPDVFRTYLQRGLPEGVVSGALVREVVSSLGDAERLEDLFSSLDAETAEALIQRLEDYEHSFDPTAVEPAIPVLLNQLPRMREGTRGMMDFGAELVVKRVILRLLRRVDGDHARLGLVERALPRIDQLTGRMELIDTVGHRENVGHKLIQQEASDRLYTQLRQQVATAPADVLAQERGLVHLFVRLADDNSGGGTAAIERACDNDAVFLQMLRAGLREQRSQTAGDYAVRSWAALPWELYERWLGEDLFRERLRAVASRIDRESLPERTRIALETAERYASGEQSNERFREGWGSASDDS